MLSHNLFDIEIIILRENLIKRKNYKMDTIVVTFKPQSELSRSTPMDAALCIKYDLIVSSNFCVFPFNYYTLKFWRMQKGIFCPQLLRIFVIKPSEKQQPSIKSTSMR